MEKGGKGLTHKNPPVEQRPRSLCFPRLFCTDRSSKNVCMGPGPGLGLCKVGRRQRGSCLVLQLPSQAGAVGQRRWDPCKHQSEQSLRQHQHRESHSQPAEPGTARGHQLGHGKGTRGRRVPQRARI